MSEGEFNENSRTHPSSYVVPTRDEKGPPKHFPQFLPANFLLPRTFNFRLAEKKPLEKFKLLSPTSPLFHLKCDEKHDRASNYCGIISAFFPPLAALALSSKWFLKRNSLKALSKETKVFKHKALCEQQKCFSSTKREEGRRKAQKKSSRARVTVEKQTFLHRLRLCR
jgi:hypothetical protein